MALSRRSAAPYLAVAAVLACGESHPQGRSDVPSPDEGDVPVPAIEWNPRSYDARRTAIPPVIDGRLDDEAWATAPASEPFVDIEGGSRPAPYLSTTMRMVWDDEHLFVAGTMEEPHLWATLTERDAVIYLDNDFEVFIDPDGDTHEYYELEINALGTEWDLFLVRPYRDGGPALHAWDIPGLRTAVALDGTLNDATDIDRGWTVEIAIPWPVLREAAHRPSPPRPGDVWRVNFSRVQWTLDPDDGGYEKRADERGEPLPEHNWVWSPQGLVAMHYPEMWGFIRFVEGERFEPFVIPEIERAKWALRTVYYAQKELFERGGRYADSLGDLALIEPWPTRWPAPILWASDDGFEAVLALPRWKLILSTDGRVRTLPTP